MAERLRHPTTYEPGLETRAPLEALQQSGEHRQLEHPELQGERPELMAARQESLNQARRETEQAYDDTKRSVERRNSRENIHRHTPERSHPRHESPKNTERLKHPEQQPSTTKEAQDKRFNEAMQTVQSQMSSSSRAFSKVIHNPAVEKASEAVGETVARPNAILSGAVAAFLFTLGIYLIARFNGYHLSGAESIAAFAIGWLCGLGFDFVRMMILGRRDV